MEYRDPVQEEWEKFQKSIQREDEVRAIFLGIPTFILMSQASQSICPSFLPSFLPPSLPPLPFPPFLLPSLSFTSFPSSQVSEALLIEWDEETKTERELMEVNEQV